MFKIIISKLKVCCEFFLSQSQHWRLESPDFLIVTGVLCQRGSKPNGVGGPHREAPVRAGGPRGGGAVLRFLPQRPPHRLQRREGVPHQPFPDPSFPVREAERWTPLWQWHCNAGTVSCLISLLFQQYIPATLPWHGQWEWGLSWAEPIIRTHVGTSFFSLKVSKRPELWVSADRHFRGIQPL